MLVLGTQAIEALMPLQRCIEVVGDAMQAVSRGEVLAPLRTVMPLGASGAMGIMPGAMLAQGCFGVKVLALYPGNGALGLPSHAGMVLLFDAHSGAPVAVLESNSLTALRTAAASAVATRALARAGGEVLALLGAGHQALWHARALAQVMPLRRLQVWSRSRASADRFAQALHLPGKPEIVIADDVPTAIRGADVICTVSAAREPILRGEWLVPGQHVNLVGASVASACEADSVVVQRSRFFVDARASAQVQAGEWLRASRPVRSPPTICAARSARCCRGNGRADGPGTTSRSTSRWAIRRKTSPPRRRWSSWHGPAAIGLTSPGDACRVSAAAATAPNRVPPQ